MTDTPPPTHQRPSHGGAADAHGGLGRPPAVDAIWRPIQETLSDHALAGALLLLGATALALALANSPLSDAYHALWETPVVVGGGAFVLEQDLLHWVNDALMALFFFQVGLEIKYEAIAGELASPRRLALPLAAAVGGMVVPSLLFVAITAGTPLVHGWGMTMATDIAFALGVIAVLGARVPVGLKVFLTALAIVDDIGSVLVIALFYAEGLSLPALAVAAALLMFSVVLNRIGVRHGLAYLVVGLLVWLCFLHSGVHATLAAVLMALTIPARTKLDAGAFAHRVQRYLSRWRATPDPPEPMLSAEQQRVADGLVETVERGTAPLQRFMNAMAPVASFVVLPVFALANAGVTLHADEIAAAPGRLLVAIVVGLVVGKPLGIFGATLIARRLGLVDLPAGVTRVHVLGTGLVAGVGFTMSLFISGLAFADPVLQHASKLAILCASLLAASGGAALLLWHGSRERARAAAPASRSGTAGEPSDGDAPKHNHDHDGEERAAAFNDRRTA